MQKKIAIIGSQGRLGLSCCRYFSDAGWTVEGFSRADGDLSRLSEIKSMLQDSDFEVLINTAGSTNVDLCEKEPELSRLVNAEAPGTMAAVCRERGAKMVHISTDYVFDGKGETPITEEMETNPISVYGQTKLDGEKAVLESGADSIVARVSWLFGPERPAFPEWIVEQAKENDDLKVVSDKWSSPTSAPELSQWLEALIRHPDAAGVFHLSNSGGCSWLEYAEAALKIAGENGVKLKSDQIQPIALSDMTQFLAERPRYSVLSTEKFQKLTGIMPTNWESALGEHIKCYVNGE